MTDFVTCLGEELEKQETKYLKNDHKMDPGKDLSKQIAEGIQICKIFVPILSHEYMSDEGEKWCQPECNLAKERKKIIVPIQWSDAVIPECIRFMIGPGIHLLQYSPQKHDTNQLRVIGEAVQKQLGEQRYYTLLFLVLNQVV